MAQSNQQVPSFSDVKAIYDSLPEEQKKLVAPRGRFVDSPNLQLRVLNDDKTGFAEAYKLIGGPKNSAFVTLALSPKAQGSGKGTELLQQLISRANATNVNKLIYRLDSSNKASRALIHKFVDKPSKTGTDWEEYEIDTSNVKDPYEVPLPNSIFKAVDDVKNIYKNMGYDLSDIEVKGSDRSRYESGAVTPFSVMPKKLQVGASWVPARNSIYFNPDLKSAMNLYGVKGSQKNFIRTLAAHELAHAVDQRYANDTMRKQILQQASDNGFTTAYLNNLPFEQNRDKEIFAEFLAHKALTDSIPNNILNKSANTQALSNLFNNFDKH